MSFSYSLGLVHGMDFALKSRFPQFCDDVILEPCPDDADLREWLQGHADGVAKLA
jgi:hypothetical protein